MNEERQFKIDNDNRRLLENISKILRRNKNKSVQSHNKSLSRSSSAQSSKKSLNFSARKLEHQRIEKENKVSKYEMCV